MKLLLIKLVLITGLSMQWQLYAQDVELVGKIASYSNHWQYLDNTRTVEHTEILNWYLIKYNGELYFRLINKIPKATYDFKITNVTRTRTKLICSCENKGNPYMIQIRINELYNRGPQIMILSADKKYMARTFFYAEDNML